MRLPAELGERITELANRVDSAALRRASQSLSTVYRGGAAPGPLRSEAERIAYAMVRMPATFAALRAALAETSIRLPDWQPSSMLDLGTGPGTSIWAAADIFPSLQRITAVERTAELVRLGQELTTSAREPVHSARWLVADFNRWTSHESFDLVVASYSLGELPEADRRAVINRIWPSTRGALVVIEPGTRKGFGVISDLRDQLLGSGAKLAAPCPHGRECPMRVAGDWCHFSARVERTAEHRRLKQGELGYEDEKFSYVVATRMDPRTPPSRIVRHPLRFSGFVKLQLCTDDGIRERTITKSQKESYRAVKRADWGSGWED